MLERIRQFVKNSLDLLDISFKGEIQVERSSRPEHGHFSTNLPLILAKLLKESPLSIAERIVQKIPSRTGIISKIEIKSPGFINFFLTNEALQSVVDEILKTGEKYGKTEKRKNKKIQVEFVSANPTGPLTVGHGRQAILGDTIARIFEWNGYNVDREYYYNDAGRQMRILGYSTYIRYRQLLGYNDEMPEDHYQGEYITEIAEGIVKKFGNKFKDDPENEIFKKSAEEAVFNDIRSTLKRLDIEFDKYYNEKTLYEDGHIDWVLKKLEEKGLSYKKDGAIWFRAGEFGGTEDRVLWKSVVDEATYRLPDIAYHVTKFERGYDLIIDIFGADHHATYPDVLAGLKALGFDTNKIIVLIHQFVTLTRGCEKVKMSTRKATYVTLDELIDEVGKDVVRYFFLMRGIKSHLNFDLELAKTAGEENPVFYLQYAHARISSILRNAELNEVELNNSYNLSLLNEPETLSLLNILSEVNEVIDICMDTFEPHYLTIYLQKLAAAFHKFYTEYRVLSEDKDLTNARLALIKSVKIVLANGLHLIGVSAPDRM
jgi:arginyl-tRNA synthetase